MANCERKPQVDLGSRVGLQGVGWETLSFSGNLGSTPGLTHFSSSTCQKPVLGRGLKSGVPTPGYPLTVCYCIRITYICVWWGGGELEESCCCVPMYLVHCTVYSTVHLYVFTSPLVRTPLQTPDLNPPLTTPQISQRLPRVWET